MPPRGINLQRTTQYGVIPNPSVFGGMIPSQNPPSLKACCPLQYLSGDGQRNLSSGIMGPVPYRVSSSRLDNSMNLQICCPSSPEHTCNLFSNFSQDTMLLSLCQIDDFSSCRVHQRNSSVAFSFCMWIIVWHITTAGTA